MRILAKILIVGVTAAFAATAAGLGAFVEISRATPAHAILSAVLAEPTRAALRDALGRTNAYRLAVDRDLVAFELPRAVAESDREATELALVRGRASELYAGKLPPDPGADRTETGLPRAITNQLNAERHERLRSAFFAALLATVIALSLCCYLGRNPFVLPAISLSLGAAVSVVLRSLLANTAATAPAIAERTLAHASTFPVSIAFAFAALSWASAGVTAAYARRAEGVSARCR